MTTIQYHRPKGAERFKNQYILFFSDESNPKVLFNTFIPEEAYRKAEEISQTQGKIPVVERVADGNYFFINEK